MTKAQSEEKSKDALWGGLAKNYEMVRNAEIANSFLCLLALDGAESPLSTSQISEKMATHTKGQIYKISATIKSSLETLRSAGLVEAKDIPSDKPNERKPVRMSLYKITPKGRQLLKGWVGFLDAL